MSHCGSLVMVKNGGGLATDRDLSARKVFDLSSACHGLDGGP